MQVPSYQICISRRADTNGKKCGLSEPVKRMIGASALHSSERPRVDSEDNKQI